MNGANTEEAVFQAANAAEHFDLFSLLSSRRLRPSLRASLLPLSSSPFNVRIVGSQWFSIAKVGSTFSSERRDSGFGLCSGRKWAAWPDDESPGRCYSRPPVALMGYCNPNVSSFSIWLPVFMRLNEPIRIQQKSVGFFFILENPAPLWIRKKRKKNPRLSLN